jgi:peptidoglycan/LPS O-acetylase OafA/YrhL
VYRPEIDGLRALAVIPVILFHAGFSAFSGGFVGVDIFFVISGYLITGILIRELEEQNFSIITFYERRARRILPALYFVILICVPFAWAWMLPEDLKDFFQSIVAVLFFASNVLFFTENGYFDGPSEEKPLLHTWSLAVEEQYYIFFPLLLLLLWRFGKRPVFHVLTVFALFSLVLSELTWRTNPDANFFLAHTRAWELLAGALAAFYVSKAGVKDSNTLSSIGLIVILASIFLYDDSIPFPSIYALLPVLGTVCLILFAHPKTMVFYLLSRPVFVGIGLISYSAYLWHQPILVFLKMFYAL